MQIEKHPLTQPEEIILDTLLRNRLQEDFTYSFLQWTDKDGGVRVSVVVAGPHNKDVFAAIPGMHECTLEEFATVVGTQHRCIGPTFILRAAEVCFGGSIEGSPLECLQAPGMCVLTNGIRFYSICTEDAHIVDGVNLTTLDYDKHQQH